MTLGFIRPTRRSAGSCILLLAALGDIAAAQGAPTVASVQLAIDGGLRGRRQSFIRTALVPSWRGMWGIDHVRVSYARASPLGEGGTCYLTQPLQCTEPNGYSDYAAVDFGHSFDINRSVTHRLQVLIAPGILYGFGSPHDGSAPFGAELRATIRTTSRRGHGAEFHVNLQHGVMHQTAVEIGAGFHVQLWRRGGLDP